MNRAVYTCGHITEKVPYKIEVKTITTNDKHAIDVMEVCENCLIWYRKNNLILDTDGQKERWLAFNLD